MSLSQSIPAKKEEKTHSITLGLALFSMFFGAGNLVFPLLIGQSVGSHAWFALGGLGITAIILPFLGLATMLLFQSDTARFFGRIGFFPGFALLLLLQMILGPFGVIPRLVTLMHALVKPYFFDVSLIVFSLASAMIIFVLSFRRQKIVKILGMVTPLLLLCIVLLVMIGVMCGSELHTPFWSAEHSFMAGLVGGYNTMDLIAAFMFATVMIPHFKEEMAIEDHEKRGISLLKKMAIPSLIAALLLFLTYAGLSWISAFHSKMLDAAISSEQLLSAIAIKLLGNAGGLIAALTVVLACLTTAITLVAIFADYLQKELCKEKIRPSTSLLITLAITTFFANLGFNGIAAFLGPILQIVYPGLIVLTLLNLLHSLYGWERVKLPVFLTFAISGAIFYFS